MPEVFNRYPLPPGASSGQPAGEVPPPQAPINGITNASSITSGTLDDARLSLNMRSAAVRARTIFVDADNGSDTGANAGVRGTTLPVATLPRAAVLAQPGDNIVLGPGTCSAAGLANITASGVTIIAYGAKLVCANTTAAPVGDLVKLAVNAPNCRLFGLEIDGSLLAAPHGGQDNGVIEVSAPGFRMEDCYIHDAAGYGVRFMANYSGAVVTGNCRFVNCQTGVRSATYGTADIVGFEVSDSHFENCREGAVSLKNTSAGAYSVRYAKVLRNVASSATLTNGSLGIELWGGGVVGKAVSPFSAPLVEGNRVSGYVTAISLNGCQGGGTRGNIVSAGCASGTGSVYGGVELADSNDVESDGDRVSVPTGWTCQYGYVVSGTVGTADSGATMNIRVRNGRSVGAQMGAHVYNCGGVKFSADTVLASSTSYPLSVQLAGDVTMDDVTIDGRNLGANPGSLPGMYFEYAAGATANVTLRNCRLLFTGSQPGPLVQFNGSSANGSPNATVNLTLLGCSANINFAAGGFIAPYGNLTLNTVQAAGNVPRAQGNSTQLGFPDASLGDAAFNPAGGARSVGSNYRVGDTANGYGTYFFGGIQDGIGPIGGYRLQSGSTFVPALDVIYQAGKVTHTFSGDVKATGKFLGDGSALDLVNHTITQPTGTGANALAAIPNPVDGQLVEFRDLNFAFSRYSFKTGPTESVGADGFTEVAANDNSGAWHLLSYTDCEGNEYDKGTTSLPGSLRLHGNTLTFEGWPASIQNDNGSLSLSLGGGSVGDWTSANTAVGYIVSCRGIRYSALAANVTQPLPPIGTVGDGSDVKIGYECDLWNDDATHTVTVPVPNAPGGNVVLNPGDRLYLRAQVQHNAAIPAGQAGHDADYWYYEVRRGKPVAGTANGTVVIDFEAGDVRKYNVFGNSTFTTANLTPGATARYLLTADSSTRTLTFPSGWTFLGSAVPASLAAFKKAELVLRSYGTTDADVVAEWRAQP